MSPDCDASVVAMLYVSCFGCSGGLTYIQSAVSFTIYHIYDSFALVQVPITLDVVLVVDTIDCIVELSDSVYLEVVIVAFDSFEDFLPVCVSCIIWVVGFPLMLRVFAFALLRDRFEFFVSALLSFLFQST